MYNLARRRLLRKRQRTLRRKSYNESLHERYENSLIHLMEYILYRYINVKNVVEEYWISKYDEYEKHIKKNDIYNTDVETYIQRINGIVERSIKLADNLGWKDWDDTEDLADLDIQVPIIEIPLISPPNPKLRRSKRLMKKCYTKRPSQIKDNHNPGYSSSPVDYNKTDDIKKSKKSKKEKQKIKETKITDKILKRYEEDLITIYNKIKYLSNQTKNSVENYWIRKYDDYDKFTYDPKDNLQVEDYIHNINKIINTIKKELINLAWIDWSESNINDNINNNVNKQIIKEL